MSQKYSLDTLVTYDARICGAVGDQELSVLYYIFMHYCQRKANDKNQVMSGGASAMR